MIVPFGSGGGGGKDKIRVPEAGDWRCPGCGDLQFAKNPTCRKCGEMKPQAADLQQALTDKNAAALVPITPAESPIIKQLCKDDEWTCPLCKEVSWGNRTTCRRCACPRPEGPVVINTVQHQLSSGGYIGYLPNPEKIEATSSWAKQWDTGIIPGAFALNAMQTAVAPYNPDVPSSGSTSSSSSSSDSSSSSSGSESEASPKKKKRKSKEAEQETKSSESSSSDGSGSGEKRSKKQKNDSGKKDSSKAKEKSEKPKASKEGEKKVKEKAKEKTDKASKEGKDKPKDENGKTKDKAKADAKQAKKQAKIAAKAKLEKKKKKAMDVEQELEKRRLQRERRKNRPVINLA